MINKPFASAGFIDYLYYSYIGSFLQNTSFYCQILGTLNLWSNRIFVLTNLNIHTYWD